MRAKLSISFRQALNGATLTIKVGGSPIKVRIPAGIKDGQKVRVKGHGKPGTHGGPTGDLEVAVTVKPHPVYSREGNDLVVTLPVTVSEAILGAVVDVPMIDGNTATVKVPAGSSSGAEIRVRGGGVKTSKATGDLIARVAIQVPEKPSRELKKLAKEMATAEGDLDVRASLARGRRRSKPWRRTGTDDAITFVISVAAELAGMHPQTLRQYDRLGLVIPARTKGRGRRYTKRDVQRLRDVQRMSQEEGINLAGIRRILELERRVEALEEERDALRDAVAAAEARRNRVFAASADGQVMPMRRGQRPWDRTSTACEWLRWLPHRVEPGARACCARGRRDVGALGASGAAAFEGARRHRRDDRLSPVEHET